MDRKKFLKTTASGLVAASFLPLLSFSKKTEEDFTTFENVDPTLINGSSWYFHFNIYTALIEEFSKSNGKEKEIIIHCENDGDAYHKLTYNASSSKEKTIDSKNLHFISFKLGKGDMKEDDKKFAQDSFGKSMIIEVHKKCHAVIRNDKSNLAVNFKYNADAEDCFLTSASVFHKGLADDCKELTMLRNLRENVMKPDKKYHQLISEYEIIAPQMLSNIYKADNKGEILDGIFNHLVIPAVSLVEAGKNIEAILYYKDFVEVMKQRYIV